MMHAQTAPCRQHAHGLMAPSCAELQGEQGARGCKRARHTAPFELLQHDVNAAGLAALRPCASAPRRLRACMRGGQAMRQLFNTTRPESALRVYSRGAGAGRAAGICPACEGCGLRGQVARATGCSPHLICLLGPARVQGCQRRPSHSSELQ